jgi:hypothetical protein
MVIEKTVPATPIVDETTAPSSVRFFQYQSGKIDDDFWFGHRDNLLWFYHRPGTQVWWKERRLGFSRKFREFLESTSPTDVSAPDIRQV